MQIANAILETRLGREEGQRRILPCPTTHRILWGLKRKRNHISRADQSNSSWSKGLRTQENISKTLIKLTVAPIIGSP
jgi:hypothetical protein